MENVNQIASGAVFLLVGGIVGALVDQRDRERERNAAAVLRVRRLAIIKALAGLSAALDTRDRQTARHSEEVARVAVQIGRGRGLPPDRLEVLRLAALMHDVGKIGVPDDVLFKPDSLTPAERNVINQHPEIAGSILEAIDGTRDIADIVLAHHECPDGSGYPLGLRAEQIPVEAAILSVADVFVALTEERPYKEARRPEAALAWMQSVSGTKLDAESVRVLAEITRDAKQAEIA
jgi:putative nucleotidyltransferase with HDIG domain